jgi:hypothetical protein
MRSDRISQLTLGLYRLKQSPAYSHPLADGMKPSAIHFLLDIIFKSKETLRLPRKLEVRSRMTKNKKAYVV